ncbi:hypothetical protein BHE74_00051520 [Ensete ventricosum]|nr:hypothetical protein BHE74_00051520 [Ensete ventricosum]RZS25205.1 hypothetical protein BHM03_00058372 [Ensete ventricosum]
MFVHKAKDTDKHEHFIKHLVYILTVTQRQGPMIQWLCADERRGLAAMEEVGAGDSNEGCGRGGRQKKAIEERVMAAGAATMVGSGYNSKWVRRQQQCSLLARDACNKEGRDSSCGEQKATDDNRAEEGNNGNVAVHGNAVLRGNIATKEGNSVGYGWGEREMAATSGNDKG